MGFFNSLLARATPDAQRPFIPWSAANEQLQRSLVVAALDAQAPPPFPLPSPFQGGEEEYSWGWRAGCRGGLYARPIRLSGRLNRSICVGCRVGTAHRSPRVDSKIPHPPVAIDRDDFTVRHCPVGPACLLVGWRATISPFPRGPCLSDVKRLGRSGLGRQRLLWRRRPASEAPPQAGTEGRGINIALAVSRGGNGSRSCALRGSETGLALPSSQASGARQPGYISRSRSVAVSWMSCQAFCTCTASVWVWPTQRRRV